MSSLNPPPSRKHFWRSLEELAEKPAFQDWMSREFPASGSELPKGLSRRRWIQLMGASLAFGGLTGCRWEAEEFAPFTIRPQNRIPGEKQKFSTCWEFDGVARPLTVTSIDGRPIKVEGNREHPVSQGSTSAFDQALILSLYDPDRSDGVVERVRNTVVDRSWDDFSQVLTQRLTLHRRNGGAGVAILSDESTSLTRNALLDRIQNELPKATLTTIPEAASAFAANAQRKTPADMRAINHIENAKVILCVDSDLLGLDPSSQTSIREWSTKRDPDGEWMNRLYCIESDLSLTGSNADHRLALNSAEMNRFLLDLEDGLVRARTDGISRPDSDKRYEQMLAALIDDFVSHPGESLIVAGPNLPVSAHETVRRLNASLGNVGKTVAYVEDTRRRGQSLDDLIFDMSSGQVETLLILNVNPAYGLKSSKDFIAALKNVPFPVHAGLYRDETAQHCRWHLPLAHSLESWGDSRSVDGTICISQPLIDPLMSGRTAFEILESLTSGNTKTPEKLVRESLTRTIPGLKSDKEWRRAIHDGFIRDSQLAEIPVNNLSIRPAENTSGQEADSVLADYELVIRLDSSVYDGRFANNGWLQETPDPITKLTWDNAAVMGPSTAKALAVKHGQLIQITSGGVTCELPVFELPGVARGSIQLRLGYGRRSAGRVGGHSEFDAETVGTDVSPFLEVATNGVILDPKITPTASHRELATTQDHFAIDTVGLEAIGARVGELIRSADLTEYEDHPDFAEHRGPHHPPLESLWEEKKYEDHSWGMSIDLNKCIGCNACMVACQSENNVPIVGREQVLAGREMHWIRVDRYFSGDLESPEVAHQPMACHHCDNAPCEQVCPVAATVHSDEGLNDMVYNRCIGTRYCANNCPYKVRRFNFLEYNAPLEEPGRELVQLSLNPEVTIRSRGVMEKCTYCVHRIQDTKIDAKNERRVIADGEIQTACQEACPSSAIVFGDLNDPDSEVRQLHESPRAYGVLAELNTKPRTRYLARVRNSHAWLASWEDKDHQHAAGAHH